jgi:hypothetical protein
LEYTILKPDWFTNGNEVGYALTQKGEPEAGTAISRKSIAAMFQLSWEIQDYTKMKIWESASRICLHNSN